MNLLDRSEDNIKGLTLVELLLTVAIISILAAATTPFISSFVLRNNQEMMVAKIISQLVKAQSNAMDKKSNDVWGVCLINSSIRLYKNNCASAVYKEDFEIPSSVTVSNFSSVIFTAGRGEPSSVQNITISTNLGSNQVIVNSAGNIEAN